MSSPRTPCPADVPVAVLAGGLGTRLRSRVADRPKVLAEVRGRPFLAWLLDRLSRAGFRRAVLCTGYMGEEVEAAFGDRHGELELAYSREPEPLGTGGALRLAAPLLGSGTTLVLNGDSFCDADLESFLGHHLDRGAVGTLLLTEVADAGRYGRVVLDEEGAVTAFQEKSSSGAGWINAGVYLFEPEVLASLRSTGATGTVSLERDILSGWIGRGLVGYRASGRFIDIGTPESYGEADRFFASEAGSET